MTDRRVSRLAVRCPECGEVMVQRFGRRGGAFLGCTAYPQCRATAEIPAYARLVRSGAPRLPGMED